MTSTILTIALVVVIVAAFIYRKALLRLVNVSKAEANMKVKEVEENAAVAMQQQRIDNATKKLKDARKKYGQSYRSVETQTRVVSDLVNEEAAARDKLEARKRRIEKLQQTPDNESTEEAQSRKALLARVQVLTAKQLAEWKQLKARLVEANDMLKVLQKEADHNAAQIHEAENDIEDAQKELNVNADRLQMAEATAELKETSHDIESMVGGTSASLKGGTEAIKRQIDAAVGRAKAVQKLDFDPDKELDKELAAMDAQDEAEAQLATFMAGEKLEAPQLD